MNQNVEVAGIAILQWCHAEQFLHDFFRVCSSLQVDGNLQTGKVGFIPHIGDFPQFSLFNAVYDFNRGAVRNFCDFNTAAGFIIVPLCPYLDAAPSGFADFPELVCIFQQESAARKVWAKQRFGDICFWIFQQGNGRITDFCQIKRTDIACHRNRNAHVGIHQNRWECRREQGRLHHGIVIVRDKIHGILVNIPK